MSAGNGKAWSLLIKRDDLPKPIKDGKWKQLMQSFAWDWKRNILYATSMGMSLHRAELPQRPLQQSPPGTTKPFWVSS